MLHTSHAATSDPDIFPPQPIDQFPSPYYNVSSMSKTRLHFFNGEVPSMNRRQFLQAGAGLTLTSTGAYAEEFQDKKYRVGLIGTGWYGKCDLWRLIQVAPVEVVSLCDVDSRMLAAAADIAAERQASHKKPRTYHDYREMLREKDLDIVLIATPDHWHALPMIAACEAGADIYCQKPISVDIP